jgi:hypothetical protein
MNKQKYQCFFKKELEGKKILSGGLVSVGGGGNKERV